MTNVSDYPQQTHLVALCTLSGVSPRLFDLLFARYGETEKILKANKASLLKIDGMSSAQAGRITSAKDRLEDARRLLTRLEERDITVVTFFDRNYGELLSELNDPPPILFVRGSMPDRNEKSVTLIGTESATAPGIELTTELARRFGQAGVQVISSLRGGIDAAAHLGARAGGGTSYAVIDTGFDRLSDEKTMPLAIDIVEHGGVISEYAPDHKATQDTLEQSNRLLVGLSQAVVVTEVYGDSDKTLDLLSFCRMIGKMAFMMVDPDQGAFADEKSLQKALEYGALPMKGLEHTEDIIRSLV
ncbi:hypothetical protein GF420_07710 [candidate division GN15 bacterium]|nr:hypothetical protein [candidate division GN15 bacterium]